MAATIFSTFTSLKNKTFSFKKERRVSICEYMMVRVTHPPKPLKDIVHIGRIKPAARCVTQTLQGQRKSSECVCVCVRSQVAPRLDTSPSD